MTATATRMERYRLWRDTHVATSPLRRRLWRALVGVVGTLISLGGLALVPLPGPGWLVVVLGLAVLATEFAWAERLLTMLRAALDAWAEWLRRAPWWARVLVGLVGLVVVAAVLVLVLRLTGTPGWVPEWVPFVG
ncbi:PGPGW domain-containing protein [Motilibacter peucedani]|nr:PGPGW domain-containing protein [Motilibacter peucedani]